MAGGVSSRTRSKNVPLFDGRLSLDGSSLKKRKSDKDYGSGAKKRRVKDEPFLVPENVEVISVDDDDESEKGLKQCDEKMLEKEVKIDESGESENPITICSDDEEHFVGCDSVDEVDDEEDEVEDGVKERVKIDERGGIGEFDYREPNLVLFDDSDNNDVDDSVESGNDGDSDENGDDEDDEESEEDETSDEDFEVDEMNEVSDNDDDSSCGSDADDEKKMKKRLNKDFNVVEELVREAIDRKRGISVNNDEIEHSDYGRVTNNTTFEKKGSFDPMKGRSSSNQIKESKKQKAKTVVSVSDNDSDDDDDDDDDDDVKVAEVKENAKANECVSVGDSDKEKEQDVKGLGVGGVSSSRTRQEKMRDSGKQKMVENKQSENYKGRVNFRKGDYKKESLDNNGLNQSGKNRYFTRKDFGLVKLLAECYNDKKDTMKIDPTVLEVNDDVNRPDTRKSPVFVEAPQRIWSLKKVQEVKMTEEEERELKQKEALKPLWEQMDAYLEESKAESMIGNIGTNRNRPPPCEHDIILDEEIGEYCKLCGVVTTEMKYISPRVMDTCPNERLRNRSSTDDSANDSFLDRSQSQFNASDGDFDANVPHKKGTVWDLIPDVKETLYPHQREGFEVIWKNLAGSIERKKLKNADPKKDDGCIISHAPGTGKTRLTIVFLMSYLKVFQQCCPVIIAPANLLRTWEDEFKKWEIGVPFHNLNSPELSGNEHDDAVNLLDWSQAQHSKDDTRIVKLISWFKEKSILGISYTLYQNLVSGVEYEDLRGKSENVKRKIQASVEKRKIMRNFLLEKPGLLVLDEGHTPRNQRSCIWKVFTEIPTKKRIILSGTPFQNNLLELYNTLSLVKPSFPSMLPADLKKFCQKQVYKKASKELSWESDFGNTETRNASSDDNIQLLRSFMDPFVHVHKGEILQKKLPGLRECVLVLKPNSFHKQILESFKSSQNAMIFENNQTMTSIHPSLFLECKLFEEEKSAVEKTRLEKLRLDYNAGGKTWFLMELVSLCSAANERVLVFSQFLRPLRLIIDQLISAFKWTEEEEILYMHGKVKDRQSIIDKFNDPNSRAKVLLASTRACSEGISLVGASRVVLLDVEWNPSVEKQAISRAYRIGQMKPVHIYHLLTKGTRECDKYCKQTEKYRLSELVFSDKNANNNDESKSRAPNIEDTILDKMIRHEDLKDLFEDFVIQTKEREL